MLRCLKESAQTCEFYDNVFETNWKWLELRALCFPAYQIASSPPRCQGSSYLTRIMRNIYCFPTATMIREGASVLRYTYIVYLVLATINCMRSLLINPFVCGGFVPLSDRNVITCLSLKNPSSYVQVSVRKGNIVLGKIMSNWGNASQDLILC